MGQTGPSGHSSPSGPQPWIFWQEPKKKKKARVMVQSPPQTQCIHFHHSYHELMLTATNHH